MVTWDMRGHGLSRPGGGSPKSGRSVICWPCWPAYLMRASSRLSKEEIEMAKKIMSSVKSRTPAEIKKFQASAGRPSHSDAELRRISKSAGSVGKRSK